MVGVGGSNPLAPTKPFRERTKDSAAMPSPFLLPSFCLYSAVSPTAERAPVRGTGAACFFYARRIMAELLDLFRLQHPIWEMVLRGTVIYIGLLLVFRFLLHRDVGSMSVADLLFVV